MVFLTELRPDVLFTYKNDEEKESLEGIVNIQEGPSPMKIIPIPANDLGEDLKNPGEAHHGK